jgi:hypothetical protein
MERGETRPGEANAREVRAFRAEGQYLAALGPSLDGLRDRAVEDGADPEVIAFYDYLRRIRRAFLEGRLPQLVHGLYGPEPPAS